MKAKDTLIATAVGIIAYLLWARYKKDKPVGGGSGGNGFGGGVRPNLQINLTPDPIATTVVNNESGCTPESDHVRCKTYVKDLQPSVWGDTLTQEVFDWQSTEMGKCMECYDAYVQANPITGSSTPPALGDGTPPKGTSTIVDGEKEPVLTTSIIKK